MNAKWWFFTRLMKGKRKWELEILSPSIKRVKYLHDGIFFFPPFCLYGGWGQNKYIKSINENKIASHEIKLAALNSMYSEHCWNSTSIQTRLPAQVMCLALRLLKNFYILVFQLIIMLTFCKSKNGFFFLCLYLNTSSSAPLCQAPLI